MRQCMWARDYDCQLEATWEGDWPWDEQSRIVNYCEEHMMDFEDHYVKNRRKIDPRSIEEIQAEFWKELNL